MHVINLIEKTIIRLMHPCWTLLFDNYPTLAPELRFTFFVKGPNVVCFVFIYIRCSFFVIVFVGQCRLVRLWLPVSHPGWS